MAEYIWIVRNKHTNRIIDVRMNRSKILVVGLEEKLEKKWVPDGQKNNVYRRYRRKIGKILRRPNQTSGPAVNSALPLDE